MPETDERRIARQNAIRNRDADKLQASLGKLPRKVERPGLVVLVGLPGSGKSHFAHEIARRIPAVILDSDALRGVLFAEPRHTKPEHARLFPALHVLIDRLMSRGNNVIVDATNLKESSRRPYYEVAERRGAKVVVVRVWAPKRVIRDRLRLRDAGHNAADRSTATLEVYEKMRADAEPIRRRRITVNTVENPAAAVDRVLRELQAVKKMSKRPNRSRKSSSAPPPGGGWSIAAIAGGVLLLVIGVVAIIVLFAGGGGTGTTSADSGFTGVPTGYPYPVQAIERINDRSHFPLGTVYTQYNSNPPTSGPHASVPATWGIHDEAVMKEQAVHNMEHGGVVVWYNCNAAPILSGDDCSALRNQLSSVVAPYIPAAKFVLMTPYQDMDHRIALTAWGFLDTFDTFDGTRVKAFIDTFTCNFNVEHFCK